MTDGWIKLYRQVEDNEFYFLERFTKMSAWLDLLILANHKPQTLFIRGVELRVETGQLCYSQLTLSKRWQWNRRTVDKFLKLLENREMIHIRITNVTTVITILNWEKYQGSAQQNAQQSNTKMHTKVHTNKNDKNEKNDKKYNNIPPTLDEVTRVAVERDYPNALDEVVKFYDYYESNGWKVGKVRMVNWGATLANWFRNKKQWGNNGQSGNRKTEQQMRIFRGTNGIPTGADTTYKATIVE